MLKRLPFIYPLILVCIILLLSYALWHRYTHQPPVVQPQVIVKSPSPDVLAKWVYDRSSRISRTTCSEIAREVLRTKYPLVMLAIIEVESMRFSPGALSPKIGAVGWCQVRYEVHGTALIKAGIIKEKRDLWDVGPNIRAGAFIFEGYMHQHKNNIPKALECYLGGKDGAYLQRILINLSELYIATL